ncbi:hypothetical protein GWK47_018757 [Chionoecetes opilio]|uniref:Uncharacterized protein n=1 Tax=Chionoecetes opilio TaxID=41210 RepID=A0A8J4XUW5_CHIOP|nr:hypothetical protein GWK47_018757 [Chionoecetes opilio]
MLEASSSARYAWYTQTRVPCATLFTSIDGAYSSDTGFTGTVCSLLSSVMNAVQTQSSEEWLTTAQSSCTCDQTSKWTDCKELNTRKFSVKYCLQVYFKTYYTNIKVHQELEDGPKHNPHAAQSEEVAAQEVQNKLDLLRADTEAWYRTIQKCPPLADGESE